ncbi:hypothetical protein V3C40_24495 [Janthinobacterium sp. LS2A]|uniref:hypothetical protein n=1 Tax=Janthinobacterium sp. LS2A TaxID=3118590 RepID=UPI002F93960D
MDEDKNKEIFDINDLARTALIVEDFDDAMGALGVIKAIDKSRAKDVALKILKLHVGDVFYQAYAFEILYDISLSDAVKYMEENANMVHPYILRSMLACVAIDAGLIDSRSEILSAVGTLRCVLMSRSLDDLSEVHEQKKFFEDAFPHV